MERQLEKGICLGMRLCGKTFAMISAFRHVPESTIRFWWKQFLETGTVLRKTGSCGRRKTTERSDRSLIRWTRQHTFSSARQLLQAWGEAVTCRTVCNRLRATGFRCRRPIKRPLLTQQNRIQREQWAMQRVHWRSPQWNRIVWTDESRFCM